MSTNWKPVSGLGDTFTALAYFGVGTNVTGTTLALDSAYTYALAGDALLHSAFFSPETANLTDIWFYVVSYTGTWANTDGNINWQIREGMNGTRIPGTTLVASGTFTLDGSTTGWHRITGLTASLTAGKLYTIILADADGGASDYVTLQVRWGASPIIYNPLSEVGTTANGFSSAYSQTAAAPAGGFKVGDTFIGGNIFDAINTVTTGTYERGCKFRPPDDVVFVGFAVRTDTNVFTGGHAMNLYADGVNPGGSKLAQLNPGAMTGTGTNPIPGGILLPPSSWVDLDANTWYRAVVAPASNLTVPRKATYTGSPDATLLAGAMPLGGDCYWTEESGGAWSDDSAAVAQFGPILVPRTAAGGGGGLLRPVALTGGLT